MKKARKITSLVLALLMLISVFAVIPITAGALTSGNYEYKVLNNNTVEITKYKGSESEVVIPSELNGYSVVSIGEGAFTYGTFNRDIFFFTSNNKNLRKVTIPDSVTNISDFAFYQCINLTDVSIPNNVQNIGDYAFYSCTNLTSITIPEKVTNLGDYAFYSCTSLTSITIPDTVTSIGSSAFGGCTNLSSVAIPNSVTSISSAFSCCTSLTSITIPNSVTNISGAFSCCTNLASITIPNSVTNISGAFSGCTSLTSVTIPDGVTSIGTTTFSGCTNLKNIAIPDSVMSIGDSAFYSCSSLTSITIPNSITSIGSKAFSGCTSLTSIIIPNSVTSIGYEAYSDCTSLTSANLPDNNNVTFNYYDGSHECTKESTGIFMGCSSLKTVYFGTGVKVIPQGMFYNCSGLENIVIPKKIHTLASQAFWNCINLKSITILNPDCEINDAYDTISGSAIIYGYTNSTAQLYAANYNRNFVEIKSDDDPIIPTQSCEPTEPTNPTEPTSAESWVVVKAPTCDESGVEVNYATQKSRTIPALGHKTKLVGKKAATYFAKGYTGDKKCSVCGEVVSKGKAIAKLKLATPKVKITAGKQKLTVKYTKVKDATGFQVKYTYNGKTTTKTYASKKSVTKILKKLKKGSYKVSVRALIKSNGKTAYSGWTKAKQVKVK